MTRRRPGWFVRLWRRLRWWLLGLVGFIGSTYAAYGVGLVRYERAGRPNHYEVRERDSRVTSFLYGSRLFRVGNQLTVFGLETRVGLDYLPRVVKSSGWDMTTPTTLKHPCGATAVVHADRSGIITRYVVHMRGVSIQAAQGFERRLSTNWMRPDAALGSLSDDVALHELAVWRTPMGAGILEVEPNGFLYDIRVTMYSDRDPLLLLRPDTAGVPPWHPLAAELREALLNPPAAPTVKSPPIYAPAPRVRK